MKKFLKVFLIFFFLFSFVPNVFAKEISIKNISVKDKSGDLSISDLEVHEETITSNITFNKIHDFVTLDVEIENGDSIPYALESVISNNSALLSYKVSLISLPEMKLLYNSQARVASSTYWLLSPHNYYNSSYSTVNHISSSGTTGYSSAVYNTFGVRPAISLIPGIEYSRGDGSTTNPYVIKYND